MRECDPKESTKGVPQVHSKSALAQRRGCVGKVNLNLGSVYQLMLTKQTIQCNIEFPTNTERENKGHDRGATIDDDSNVPGSRGLLQTNLNIL